MLNQTPTAVWNLERECPLNASGRSARARDMGGPKTALCHRRARQLMGSARVRQQTIGLVPDHGIALTTELSSLGRSRTVISPRLQEIAPSFCSLPAASVTPPRPAPHVGGERHGGAPKSARKGQPTPLPPRIRGDGVSELIAHCQANHPRPKDRLGDDELISVREYAGVQIGQVLSVNGGAPGILRNAN